MYANPCDRFESEGYDRKHMRLPDNQIELINKIAEAQPNFVVVLHNGSPVEMPWISNIKGLLEAYLSGQAVGGAVMDILSGKVNPSGKLAESFPLRLQDNPSYLNFPGDMEKVEYRERLFIGYRYYDKKEMSVLFPFGHGLSYTSFEYSEITADKKEALDTESVTVSLKVKNTGNRAGKEVVQLYVAPKSNIRPVKELKGFAKVELAPGEEKTVLFTLDKRSFAFYDVNLMDWRVEGGTYGILVGASSRDIRLETNIVITPSVPYQRPLTINPPMAEVLANPKGAAFAQKIMSGSKMQQMPKPEEGSTMAALMEAMRKETPLRAVGNFGGIVITQDMLDEALK